jgi:hypothetical protein
VWHTRPPNFTDQPRDVIWQILTRKQPVITGAGSNTKKPGKSAARLDLVSWRKDPGILKEVI